MQKSSSHLRHVWNLRCIKKRVQMMSWDAIVDPTVRANRYISKLRVVQTPNPLNHLAMITTPLHVMPYEQVQPTLPETCPEL